MFTFLLVDRERGKFKLLKITGDSKKHLGMKNIRINCQTLVMSYFKHVSWIIRLFCDIFLSSSRPFKLPGNSKLFTECFVFALWRSFFFWVTQLHITQFSLWRHKFQSKLHKSKQKSSSLKTTTNSCLLILFLTEFGLNSRRTEKSRKIWQILTKWRILRILPVKKGREAENRRLECPH